MKKKFRIRPLFYIALLVCVLLGTSQADIVTAEPDPWEPQETEPGIVLVEPDEGLPQVIDAGMVSAEQDPWLPEGHGEGSRAVQPIGSFISIAVNNAIYQYAPAVAHGGQHYVVIYLVGDGHVYASVRNNDGTSAANYLIDSAKDFVAPRIAYHAPTGLFVVAYHYYESGVYYTRVGAVSPTGVVGSIWQITDAHNPDIGCSQVDNVCLVAYEQQTSNPIRGYYLTITPGGITAFSSRRNLSNEAGRRPYLAWGSGTFRYMLTFTFTYLGVDYPVYNHLYDLATVGDDSYVSSTLYVLDSWTGFPNNKVATGVAYDPCTEHFLIMFDHDVSGNLSQVNVWAAAIHKHNQGTRWHGPIANRSHREQSGGISFVTDDNLPAACGVMNKLAVIYTNYNENRFYALEVKGNNNKTSPVYTRDEFDDHFIVANLGQGQPLARPAISSGSENGEMLLVFDILYATTSNIHGRLVHVWQSGNIFLPLILR